MHVFLHDLHINFPLIKSLWFISSKRFFYHFFIISNQDLTYLFLKYLYIILSFFLWSFRENWLVSSNEVFTARIYSMKVIQENAHIINSLCFILNILWVIDLSLILLNTSWGIYSVFKESKYAAQFLFVNNETQYFPLIFIIQMYDIRSIFCSRKIFSWKKAIKSRFIIEITSHLDIFLKDGEEWKVFIFFLLF